MHQHYEMHHIWATDNEIWTSRIQKGFGNFVVMNAPQRKLELRPLNRELKLGYKPQECHLIVFTIHNNKNKCLNVHRTIYECFYGKIPNKLFVLHRDGNPQNNKITNLYLGDRFDNAKDAKRLKEFAIGVDNKSSKLNENIVEWIRNNTHLTNRKIKHAINENFGIEVNVTTIGDVINKKTWIHI